MKHKGQFILLDNAAEFCEWLLKQNISRKIWRSQMHHTYLPDYKSFNGSNHFEILESMDYYHETHGFSDSAHTLATFPDGKIAVCRPFNVMPAGIMGGNEGAVTYENIGNFDADDMTAAQANIITESLKAINEKFYIIPTTDSIEYHHWYDLNTGKRTNGLGVTKTCPGRKFFGGNTVEAAQKYFIPLLKGESIIIPKEVISLVLKKGINDVSGVKSLQEKLNRIGYNLVVDGDFGGLTEAAVKDFQKNSKLIADGIVGDSTMAAIDKAVAAINQPIDYKTMYTDLLVRYEVVKAKLETAKKALE